MESPENQKPGGKLPVPTGLPMREMIAYLMLPEEAKGMYTACLQIFEEERLAGKHTADECLQMATNLLHCPEIIPMVCLINNVIGAVVHPATGEITLVRKGEDMHAVLKACAEAQGQTLDEIAVSINGSPYKAAKAPSSGTPSSGNSLAGRARFAGPDFDPSQN